MTRGRQSNARNKPAKAPPPPAGLNEAQAQVWKDACKGQTAEWLETGPGPLLRAYCVVTVGLLQAEQNLTLAQVNPDNGPKDILAKLEVYTGWLGELGRLARALRLTPQSRVRADKSGNLPGNPWEGEGDTD